MKLEARTMQILKNFATINPSMLFLEGNIQSTIGPQKNILARATIEERIPNKFAIYDLSKFLGVLSLFSDPEIEFDSKRILINQNRQSVEYTSADPELIIAPSEKLPTFSEPEVKFLLPSDAIQTTIKALGALHSTHVIIEGDGENVSIGAGKPSDPTCDTFKTEIGLSNHVFKFAFKAEILKILPIDYNVALSSRFITHFKGSDIEYWIMADTNYSEFGQ
jgi:hypothetical protein